MGFSQLFWAILLVVVCAILLLYPLSPLKNKEVCRVYIYLVGSLFVFLLVGLLFFQWIVHDPSIDFYHSGILGGNIDKIAHISVAFLITLPLLIVYPRKSTLIIIILFTISFEWFEFMFVGNFASPENMDQLLVEIKDSIFDVIFNIIGVLLAFLSFIFIRKDTLR